MTLFAAAVGLLLAALASTAHAQGVPITISQPAEATTMDPGRSTPVLTVPVARGSRRSLSRP
jgi:hypothetical protein